MTDPHDEIAHRLAGRGQRYTDGRRRLVETMLSAGRPLTLPDIVATGTGIKSSSAYRNLDALEAGGIVRRLSASGDHAHFELAEPLLDHHHHLICVECGSIADIHLDADVERLVDQRLNEAAKAQGFSPLSHTLDLHGTCKNCC